jgi:hypothetical protein
LITLVAGVSLGLLAAANSRFPPSQSANGAVCTVDQSHTVWQFGADRAGSSATPARANLPAGEAAMNLLTLGKGGHSAKSEDTDFNPTKGRGLW